MALDVAAERAYWRARPKTWGLLIILGYLDEIEKFQGERREWRQDRDRLMRNYDTLREENNRLQGLVGEIGSRADVVEARRRITDDPDFSAH